MLFICYPKCGTCQKARAWLDEKGLSYSFRDIKTENPSYEELKGFWEKSGKPLKALFNTSGLLYKELGLKDKLPAMTEEDQLRLLATDGNPAPHTYINSGLATQPQILEDGSLVVLDAGSALTTRFGWRTRRVELQQGRMQLRVAAAARPMRVQAGNSTLRDIGTTFQVELLDDGRVGVALLDGALDVASRGEQKMHQRLRPGEQLQVRRSGLIEPSTPLSRQQAEAWLHGQLLFDATPLSVAVAQMNRYTATPLVIADPAIANLTVNGSFRAGDQAALLSALELGWSVGGRPRADGALELRGLH